MKKACIALTFLFSPLVAETSDFIPPLPAENINKYDNFNRRFIPYVKIGPEINSVNLKAKLMPHIGFGFRSESHKSGVDISFSGAYLDDKAMTKVIHPRLLYIHFLSPGTPRTFYYGFGGSWGTINNPKSAFSGMLADIDFGYELQRDSNIRQMIDLNIASPLLPFYKKGPLPLPSAELSYSLGF